jgi:K+-sensing histidine kinase KdpD
MKSRVKILFQNTTFHYLFAIAAVASVFALRKWLIPFTGTGAPFVLFFAAVLVTSLLAGVGPGICAVLLSMPLAAYTFVVGAGYPVFSGGRSVTAVLRRRECRRLSDVSHEEGASDS